MHNAVLHANRIRCILEFSLHTNPRHYTHDYRGGALWNTPSVHADVGVVDVNLVRATKERNIGVLGVGIGEDRDGNHSGGSKAREDITAGHAVRLHLHARGLF